MQIFHFLFLHAVCFLLCASFNVNAQRKQFNISLGSSLAPTTNSSWLSRSGLYAFGFYPQGKAYAVGIFLAGIPEKTVVWTANRDDPPVSGNASLLLNTEGRLVLQSARGQATPVVAQGEVGPASYASMLDSGNFVLHNSSGGIIWQSFDHPTDTILTGQSLLNGQELVSNVSETDHSTGRFFLAMQGDGNLVQYPVEKIAVATAYWASGTVGWGADVRLSLDSDGHLYLHNSTGFSIMNLTAGIPTGRTVYFMKIDWDGIFRLYSHNLTQNNALSILWESSTDKCQPKGQCGFNSYCIVNPNQQPGCRCLPGFVYVDRENLYSGCKRNFAAERFINNHGTVIYSMREVKINVFEDVPYSVLQKTKDECKQACLEDVICEAALFNIKGECRMQRLPLRFAQRDESNIVFVKVYDPVSSTGDRPHLPINEGKKYLPMDMIIIDQVILADWAYQCFDSRNLSQLIGDEEVELKQLERIVKIALWCIIDEPSFRPSMKKVLLMLEGTVDIPIPPYCTSYLASI
ncbi:hypothetical protein Pint_26606 [Pistacia integerrima]|uniref:Uncharacterized protein n=1 Tax=Pistacia integerrima TaxID=434235 RepID=A0ACC0YPY5_9ROSI|nr:hypothetical protein Pint_26606 [Pistacia integerrima]